MGEERERHDPDTITAPRERESELPNRSRQTPDRDRRVDAAQRDLMAMIGPISSRSASIGAHGCDQW